MYCKNCGSEVASDKEICTTCGFKVSDGNKFCHNCGTSVLPGQAMCVKCGFMLDNQVTESKNIIKTQETVLEEPQKDEKDYKKYVDRVKKTKMLTLIMHIISVIIALALVFLPIYEYKFTPKSMDDIADIFDDIESWDELDKLVDEDGNIYKEFSLFDDLKIIIGGLTEKTSVEFGNIIPFLFGIFAIFEAIFVIVLLCVSIPQILKTIDDLKNIDKATMITFNEIKKSGNSNKKENTMKKQTVISLIIYAVFDVIFTVVEGTIYADFISEFGSEIPTRHMMDFSGVSVFMYVLAIVFIGYLVVSSMKKKEENKILEDITQEEYSNN